MFQYYHWCLSHIILVIFLSSLGNMKPEQPQHFRGFFNIYSINLYPYRYPFILLAEQKQLQLKSLTQGHKHHGHSQDLNPHSDDSAIISQIYHT